MAMPWKLAKAKAAAISRGYHRVRSLADYHPLIRCMFPYSGKSASIAAHRHIPMVVENVKGAQPWVGRRLDGYSALFALLG